MYPKDKCLKMPCYNLKGLLDVWEHLYKPEYWSTKSTRIILKDLYLLLNVLGWNTLSELNAPIKFLN